MSQRRYRYSDLMDGGPVQRMRSNVAPKRFGVGAHKPVDWTCTCGAEHKSYVVTCSCGVWRDRRERGE